MTTKLKCLLLDDELPALRYIKTLCEEIPNVEVIKAFNDSELFLKSIHQIDFDLCILDIQMPQYTGLEVAKYLKNELVIFTTAHKEFAADAFDLNAVDYIRKPVQKERFVKAIEKAKSILDTKNNAGQLKTIWNTDKGKAIVLSNEILYIEAAKTDARDKIMHCIGGKKIILKNTSFTQILSNLPLNDFCRINKKEIISINTVRHFTSETIFTSIKSNINSTFLNFLLSSVYRSDFNSKIKS